MNNTVTESIYNMNTIAYRNTKKVNAMKKKLKITDYRLQREITSFDNYKSKYDDGQ